MQCLLRKYAVVIIFSVWENRLKLWMDAAGCNLLLFHQILHFLYIRNLLYHLHTASQSLVTILCGVVDCLLAIRCLQLRLLQCRMTDELELLSRLWINMTAPVITCVVPSPTLWMVRCRRLSSHEVRSAGLDWDGGLLAIRSLQLRLLQCRMNDELELLI